MALTALVERGIGATRALVLDGGALVEVHFEADDAGPLTGAVLAGRLATILVPGRRGIVATDSGDVLVEPLPGLAEGARVHVEIVREAIAEAGRPRLPKGRIVDGPQFSGPSRGATLAERLAARRVAVEAVGPGDDDLLDDTGWGDAVEQALTGHVAFAGGLLTLSPTPAMTVIDVDGPGEAAALALAAAGAAAAAIRRFGIGGSIGIDLPTLAGKAARTAIGEWLDATLPPPFERTAVNGFGFVQIVRPRLRASLLELARTPGFHAIELLRRATRGPAGGRELTASPAVVAWIEARPALVAALARHVGGSVTLHGDPGRAMSAGDVHGR